MMDPAFEYEAPMYIDFSEPIPDDPEADAWFGVSLLGSSSHCFRAICFCISIH